MWCIIKPTSFYIMTVHTPASLTRMWVFWRQRLLSSTFWSARKHTGWYKSTFVPSWQFLVCLSFFLLNKHWEKNGETLCPYFYLLFHSFLSLPRSKHYREWISPQPNCVSIYLYPLIFHDIFTVWFWKFTQMISYYAYRLCNLSLF